ncbi:hypothetical protein [Methyloglobulus sp.]|jgi:hypothetical protein|uniref:hypothetical protein n=1 Tax=Methyloglobulus sp. TaxID=2518622 RepID=UPI0032B7B071
MDTPLSDFFSIIFFKRNGAEIAQFRVKSFAIVIHFNVFEHLILGICPSPKAFAMHRFDFEAVVSAFHCRIIVAITFFAHATD